MKDELRVSEEFLARYNRPGPRYTSYPTAPVWNDSFGPADLRAVHSAADAAKTPVSLYMHLPFCESLCLFCACNVIIQKDKRVSIPYFDVLKKEIARVGESVSREREVVQFHWGGGTPTYSTPAQLEDLRIQPYEITRDLIQSARALGFDSINVDLIYGLPYQTAETFARTVDQIIGLGPDRIALFSYAHVPWLKKQQGSFAAHLPEGMQKFEIFRTGMLKFVEAGYLYIGMDHFAKPGDELAISQAKRTLHRNFQGYTTKAGADLYGMGVTAISGFHNAYAQNFRELPAWEKAVHERGIATMRGYHLSAEDRLRREVISRLLCHTVIPKREISAAFGIDFDQHFASELQQLEAPQSDGLLTLDADEIRATWLGRIFIRNLAMFFDPYLEQQLAAKPLFSKTL